MVRIQAFKGRNKLAKGRQGKEYWKHFVIIPRALIDALGWRKGDEVEFRLDGKRIYLKRNEVLKTKLNS